MILENMSSAAILKEIKRDMAALNNRIEKLIDSHHRDFLFAKKYPLILRYTWKSPVTFNRWHITIICKSKKERDRLESYHYITFETSHGVGLIFPCYNQETDNIVVSKYTPHFINRYKTRYLIPNNLYTPGMDTVQYFVDNTDAFFLPKPSKDNTLTCCIDNGIALGISENGISVFRTFISLDMLFKIQKRVLHSSIEYQQMLKDFINNKLDNSYKKYCLEGRIGKVAGPDPIPQLSPEEVKNLLKNKPRIPLIPPPPGRFEMED